MRWRFGWHQLIGICALLLALGSLLPRTWGFATAAVGLQQSGTFYPAASITQTEVVVCAQAVPDQLMQRNTNWPGSYFSCTNNWGRPVQVTITVLNGNGTGLVLTGHTGTVPAGATACIPGSNMRASNQNNPFKDIVYQVLVDQVDLYASLAFTGRVRVRPSNGVPTQC